MQIRHVLNMQHFNFLVVTDAKRSVEHDEQDPDNSCGRGFMIRSGSVEPTKLEQKKKHVTLILYIFINLERLVLL